ncbi:MAG: histidine kinase [Lachnospiraceae bacterium]|nr:histidine kinase [Lachnospiraceae bacterium]
MENHNAINIALDVFSIIITVIIGIYLVSRKNDTKENKCFFYVCFFNLLFIIGDLSDWCCNGLAQPWYPIALRAGQILYYSVMAPFLYTMMKYIILYLSGYEKVSKVYMRIVTCVAGLHLLGSIVTPFTGLYYVISEENIYYRGKWVALASILPIVVYTMVMILIIQFRKKMRMRVIVSLLSYMWIPGLGQLIQNLFRGVATLNPAITLSILIMFINIQLDRDIQYENDKQKLTEANIKIMLSQIQPHFLYNTLAIIRGLCSEDADKAKEAINDFSVFLRANMDSLTNELPIPFEQELLHVKSYLNLIQQMYGAGVKIEYDIQAIQFRLPALSLQPLVENAVHKGLRKKAGGGRIQIKTEEYEQYSQIIIADDGVGFNTEILEKEGHIWINNVKERLAAMCGGILFIESEIGEGTKVYIRIPKDGGKLYNEISDS